MRPDVKLGVVVSMILVFVAGTYYLYRDKQEEPIVIAEGLSALSKPVAVADQAGPDTLAASREKRRSTGDRIAKRTISDRRISEVASRRPARTPQGMARPAAGKTAGRTSNTPDRSRLSNAGAQSVTPSRKTISQQARRTPPPGRAKGAMRLLAAKGQARGAAKLAGAAGREAAVDNHRVQPGDTFSALAHGYYGSTTFTRFLIDSNPQIADPNRLRIGTIVKIPPRPAGNAMQTPASAGSPVAKASDGPPTYVVKPGDSFYVIARDVLGDAMRWKELFELNREAVKGDPTRLQAGQVLVLPVP